MTVLEIPLTQGYVALIDEEDWELCEPYNWRVQVTPKNIYVKARSRFSANLYLHRLIMSPSPGMEVDHINHIGLDCRRSNLRTCTRAQNAANIPLSRSNTSGYKGVTWNARRGMWKAQIHVAGKCRGLGYFVDPKGAAQAYNAASVVAFGEFACINEGVSCLQIAPNSLLRSDNSSGYKGVSWHAKRRRWIASIKVSGVGRQLGVFTDPWEAAQAYNVAARAIWGESAYQNERHPDPAERVPS